MSEEFDAVRIEILRGEEGVHDRTVELAPEEEETRIRIELALQDSLEMLDVRVELLLDGQPVFRDDARVAVELGETTEVDVEPRPIPAGVEVPDEVSIDGVGESVRLTGTVTSVMGDVIAGLELEWETLDPEIVDVTADGLATALAPGLARVIGRHDAFSDTVRVRIEEEPVEVVVEPEAAVLVVGQSQQFSAAIVDSDGNPISGRSVAWSSSDDEVATVDEDGRVRAESGGEATIEAASGDVSGEARVTVVPVPIAEIEIVSGDGQEAPVESTLPDPLVVRVLDEGENPVAGTEVEWSTQDSSGTVRPAVSTTDDAGTARTDWTLGTEAGEMHASATVEGLEPVTFTATAEPDPDPEPEPEEPAVVVPVRGDRQVALVGTTLPDPLVVEVQDENGASMAGVEVTWSVERGSGRVSPTTSTTNGSGRANTAWTLGPEPGEMRVSATVGALDPVTFTATAEPEPGLAAAIDVVSGDEQEGVRGQALLDPLVARVVDADGVPVPGVDVFWDLIEPPGADYGGDFSEYGPTDEDGLTSVRWTLSRYPFGEQMVEVSFADDDGNNVSAWLTATALPGPDEPPEPRLVEVVAGDGQEGRAGSQLGEPLVARLLDQHGDPMPGEEIRWSARAGGTGCLTGPRGGRCLDAMTVVTGRAGESGVLWRLGPETGTQRVVAEATRGGDPSGTYGPRHAEFRATAEPPLGRIFGTVREFNAPLGDATVELARRVTIGAIFPIWSPQGETQTNSSGGYSFEDLNPGTYRVIATKPRFTSDTAVVAIAFGDTVAVDLEIYEPPRDMIPGGETQADGLVDSRGSMLSGHRPITLARSPTCLDGHGHALRAMLAAAGFTVDVTRSYGGFHLPPRRVALVARKPLTGPPAD